jgi:hypothetical protein
LIEETEIRSSHHHDEMKNIRLAPVQGTDHDPLSGKLGSYNSPNGLG